MKYIRINVDHSIESNGEILEELVGMELIKKENIEKLYMVLPDKKSIRIYVNETGRKQLHCFSEKFDTETQCYSRFRELESALNEKEE